MPLTALDPVTALIVVDLQKGVLDLPVIHPAADVVCRAAELAGAFRRRGLPVVFVGVSGAPTGRTERPSNVADLPPGWDEFAPDLGRQPGDHTTMKRTWDALTNTDLEAHLRSRGVTQIVLAGIATSIGVESTARHARDLGFNVTLAVDAMTDVSAEAHDNSVTRVFPRLGETGTTDQIVRLLDQARA